jgi:hypothetical protein
VRGSYKLLLPEELPDRLRRYYDFSGQKVVRDKSQGSVLKIDRTCSMCGTVKSLSVSSIRLSIERGVLTGKCNKCHSRKPERPTKCSVNGCERPYAYKGFCHMHYSRFKRHGNVGGSEPTCRADGTGSIVGGYKRLTMPDNLMAVKGGTVLEHLVVMSEVIGRPIKKGETVHHKNGIRDDNRPENLELWSGSHPPGQRVLDMLEFCEKYIAEYGPLKEKLLKGET